jgi:hypothetical protein
MSKLIESIYTAGRSGRLGATVFSRNKAGLYEKVFVKPSNPKSLSQMVRRASLAELTQAWGNLTDAERGTWANETSSGFQLYVQLNSNLQVIGEPTIDNNPIVSHPSSVIGFEAAIVTTPGSEDVTITIPTAIGANEKMLVFASEPNKKPGRKIPYKALRLIAVLDNTFVSGGTVKTAYVNKFGAMPATGQKALFAGQKVVKTNGYKSSLMPSLAIGAV